MDRWSRFFYLPGLPLGKDGRRVTCSEEHISLSRKVASEGAVLLKNEEGTLPLPEGSRVAVFGKGIADYVKGGGGSGDVTVPYSHSLLHALTENASVTADEGLAAYYQDYVSGMYERGAEPGLFSEPEFPMELALRARESAGLALIALSRFSGENWDRATEGAPLFSSESWSMDTLQREAAVFEHGDFYLSIREREMVDTVLSLFDKVIVVLNTGGVIDVSWIRSEPKVKACLQAFQGGMEGGTAIADILTGKVNPSGRLPDTYASFLEDYPSTHNFHESLDYVEYQDDIFVGYRYFSTIPGASCKVTYPFGYGLSYTSFVLKVLESSFKGGNVELKVEVRNSGKRPGRDVLEVYTAPPRGTIDKPSRVLTAFSKTRLLESGEAETVTLSFPLSAAASFDEESASWTLEEGDYRILLTDDAVRFEEAMTASLRERTVVEQLSHKLQATALRRRLRSDGSYEELQVKEKRSLKPGFPRQPFDALEAVEPMPRARERRLTRDDLWHLQQGFFVNVAEGEETLESFLSRLPEAVLLDLLGGQPNTGLADTYGFGNQAEYGIPNVMTADGPAGLRITPEKGVKATSWPCATLLAATWDEDAVEAVGRAGGAEVKENNIGIWLTPAVNIHRSPMCGRNFEYYSEDPLLSGKLGAAMVRGIQSNGIGACVKHFALNNKETNRRDSDSIVSERAAREIYLKAFEIIVKEAKPVSIMSSYNIINGIRASENKDLLTGILRDEWGFEGFVTTDWWTHGEHYLEVKAGNDLKMGTGYPERLKLALDQGLISIEEIKLSARRILSAILRLE